MAGNSFCSLDWQSDWPGVIFVYSLIGPLLKHIERKKYITEREASLVVKDIAAALQFLHDKGVFTFIRILILNFSSKIWNTLRTFSDVNVDVDLQ